MDYNEFLEKYNGWSLNAVAFDVYKATLQLQADCETLREIRKIEITNTLRLQKEIDELKAKIKELENK